MSIQFHRKRQGPKGIRSDSERERAVTQVAFFRAALVKVGGGKSTPRNMKFMAKCQSMLHEREAEIRDYDSLKSGVLELPKLKRLDEIAAFIPRIRIARGVSQVDLARKLGVSKQVVNRYEESGYQSVGLARLQQILDALDTTAEIELN